MPLKPECASKPEDELRRRLALHMADTGYMMQAEIAHELKRALLT